jgi:WD40 repeat protein
VYVLEAGQRVILLRFFPDGRRLLVGLASPGNAVSFEVRALPDGDPVRLRLPRLRVDGSWYEGYGHSAAIHPGGERCYIAWGGRLFAFDTADGAPLRVPKDVRVHQVVLSPSGDRLAAARVVSGVSARYLYALTADAKGGRVVWRKKMPRYLRQVAGFLPDGERFVTVEDRVRVRAFATGDELAASRLKTVGRNQAQVSPDARHLGVVGYSSMYLFDLATLDKPRRIKGSGGNFGKFVSYAFHPDGRTLAVIHGGPTLIKVYDLETLRLVRTYRWKLGPLGAVAFSPDGMLGAAGSRDGRIVVWDVDA